MSDIGLIAPLVLLVRTVYSFRGGLVARAWGVLLFGFLTMAKGAESEESGT